MEERRSLRRSVTCLAILLAAVALVYGQTLRHDFSAWDDEFNIPGNKNLHPISWQGIWNHWRKPYGALYIPVTYTFWGLESWLATTSDESNAATIHPGVFHAGNLLLHAANVALVWSILRRTIRADLPALCGALLYAVHPLQVESVAWVTETKGLLSATFGWLAIWLYTRETEDPALEKGPLVRLQLATTCLLAIALLAKPSAVVFPGIAWVLDICFRGRAGRQSLLVLWPWLAIAAIAIASTSWIQSGDEVPFTPPPVWQRPFIAGDAIAFYLWKLVLPVNLAISYSRTPTHVLESGIAYVSWLLPVVLAGVLAALRARRVYLGALAIFVIGMLPVLGFVPFSYQGNSTVADRYVYYVSMLGPSLAVAWILARHSHALLYGAFGVLALMLAGLSTWQASYWRTDTELFRRTVEVNPRTYIVRAMLAYELWHADPPDLPGAIAEFRQSIPHSHEPAKPHTALGMLFYSTGNFDEALQEYSLALELDPRLAAAHNGRGATLLARGRRSEALTAFRRATEVDPKYSTAWFNMARVLHQNGDKAGAIETMRYGLKTSESPHPPEQALLEAWLVE
ncbi:MAG: tetratricopeptide repeat protein [Pirellulales bacterium]|nr:tetratricopeptide repeat protein [Pirellulales bacterium]